MNRECEIERSDEYYVLRFCHSGDREAFTALVERHRDSIRRILYTILRGAYEDIEDAEQEVLLALFKDLRRFTFRASFKTYLFRMCRNKGIDMLRKAKRQQNIIHKFMAAGRVEDQETPEVRAIRSSDRDELMKCLLKLSEEDRSLLLMKEVEGQSLQELGDIFHLPVGTVKSRLHRARKKAAGLLIGRV
ncbi:MAG: RNA polymerase sigma factor [Spirochaetales bacterium]|jgi:RNA polymerase sigma-70 factor (ECF subfamily)|nr:RNA polymerase sigma factor [Spirochaetales bacterium]